MLFNVLKRHVLIVAKWTLVRGNADQNVLIRVDFNLLTNLSTSSLLLANIMFSNELDASKESLLTSDWSLSNLEGEMCKEKSAGKMTDMPDKLGPFMGLVLFKLSSMLLTDKSNPSEN